MTGVRPADRARPRERRPPQQRPRRPVARACAGCGCGPSARRSTSRSAPASSSASPGSRGTARTSSSTRCAGAELRRRRGRPPRRRAATSSRSPDARRRPRRSPTCPRERRQALVRLDVDPGELRDADAARATARCGWLGPRAHATRASPTTSTELGDRRSARPDDRDHDALRRQPAEGRHRALARGRAARSCC